MAGDWIKMRADLFTHPKVVRMSSALKADTLRTVGGLMSVWCLFDAHSEDGQLEGYSFEVVDELLRWSGFSRSMAVVGWLEETPDGLALPRFGAHNGQSSKRRAQDADRKREVRKVSAPESDKKRTREEKRREEKREEGDGSAPDTDAPAPRKRSAATPDLPCPSDVDPQTFSDWLALRKAKKAPVTETVLNGARSECALAGMTLDAFLQVWCMRGSAGLQADWLKSHERQTQSRVTYAQQDEMARRARWEEMTGRKWPTDGDVIDITPNQTRIAA